MKKISVLFAFILTMSTFSINAQTSDQEQKIQTSYMLAFGRQASTGEVTYWKTQGVLTISQLVARHTTYLSMDDYTLRSTIIRSYQDGLGRNPSESEITYWKTKKWTYNALMSNHVNNWLALYPDEYSKVIKASYNYAFNRLPSDAELKFWKSQGVYSYLILVGCHQDYIRKNLSSNTNTVSLVALPAVSSIKITSSNVLSDLKSYLVAQGAGNLVAQGAGNLVAQGAGNLISQDGGSIVAAGAGNMIIK